MSMNAQDLHDSIFGRSYAVALGKRSGEVTRIAIPIEDFPAPVIAKIFAYGLQRDFNDATGGKDKSHKDKVDIVNDKIARYLRGEVGRAAGESADTLTSESRKIAGEWLRANASAAWDKMIAECKAESDKTKVRVGGLINARVDAFIEKNESKHGFKAKAQQRLDEMKALIAQAGDDESIDL